MSLSLLFPNFDPVMLSIGPLSIRWYGLMYVLAILFTWWYSVRIIRKEPLTVHPQHMGDLVSWAVLGVIIGGRLGYCFFYAPGYFLQNPLEIFMTWEGGMSFHGGLGGVLIVIYLYARSQKAPLLEYFDLLALGVPMGIAFGRLGNFINGEHWGRVTDMPWGMIFPAAGLDPRHPSQLYEAALEGVLVFLLINVANHIWHLRVRYIGVLSGLFGVLYALTRCISEVFRDPDGYMGSLTLGQAYSIPVFFGGVALIAYGLLKDTSRAQSA